MKHINMNLLQVRSRNYLSILVLLLIPGMIYAQCNLSCNTGLNVSLDVNCSATITPDILLEGNAAGCAGPLVVEVYDANDVLIPNNPVVDDTYLNQTLTVSIIDQASNNSCWGTITIEDYHAPVINCSDLEIPCNASNHPDDIGYPPVTEGCDDNPTLEFSDQMTELSCDTNYVKQIIRTWTATDASGNQSTACLQTISLLRPILADVVFPLNRDDIAAPSIDCNNNNGTDPAVTGVPMLNGQPVTNNGACNLWISYNDLPASPICDGSYAIYRTWTISETWCGNTTSTSSTQIIKVLDKTGPDLNCPADFTITANTTSCTGTFTVPAATASDNCSDDANITIQILGPYGPTTPGQSITVPIGPQTLTYIATDDCGNTSSCTTTVFMDDGVPPVAICISSTTIGLTNTDPTLINAITFDDGSYDNCGPITYLARRMDNPDCPGNDATDFDTTVPFTCCDVGSTVMVEFAVTDAINQLTNICMVEVLVQDNIPMELTCPPDITINCDQDYTDLSITGEASGNDNCGIESLVYEDSLDLDPCNIGQISRTWTLTDSYGQTTTCTQIITSVSTGPGVINFPPDILDAECGDADDVSITGEPTTSGNCNQYGAGSTDLIFFLEDSCVRKVLRTWYVVDWCSGDIETHTQLIKESDTQAPVINGVPADMVVNCDMVPPPAVVTAEDNCSDASLSFEETMDSIGCEIIITRTWTATDNCGNSDSQSQTITVTDTSPPVIMGVPADTDVPCDSIPPVPTVTASDNCSDPILDFEETTTPGTCSGDFIITRTWTATDDCGNTSSAQQVVNVADNVAPTFVNVPADANVECDSIPLVENPMISDNCDPDPMLVFSESSTPGSCNGQYTLTRTWTATDECGNSSSAQQIINVSDNTAPVFSNVPADANVECDNIPTPATPAASDNCDPQPTVTVDEMTIPGSCEFEFTLIYTWTATDDCGNTSSAQQTINVSDNTAPVITGTPADATVECDDVPAPATPTASDNCDPAPILIFNETITPGSCEDNYTITRTWTATDVCGNVNTTSQTIEVSDNTAPVLVGVPADTTVDCDEVPPPATPTASDNCDPNPDIVFVETGNPDNGCNGDFTLTRTWTATDRCGNVSSQSQLITLTDTTAPEITGVPADLDLSCDDIIPDPANPTAMDDCDDSVMLVFEEVTTPGNCINNFVITRTWTATDFCGNATTQTQTISVVDDSPPFLMGIPQSITVDCDDIPNPAMPTASDNCDDDVTITFVETTEPGGCAAEFAIIRTWTATDNCGNAVTGTQTINTIDDQSPVLSEMPVNMTVECDQIPMAPDITAIDNCDPDVEVVLVETQTPGPCNNEFTLVRTWTATDDCGNSVMHTQTIDVEDITSPFLPPITPILFVDCDEIPMADMPVPVDNCDPDPELVFTEDNNASTCVNGAYTIVRTWIATDNCGNQLIQVQTINVTDNNNPMLVNVPADITVECDSIPAVPDVTATDICDMDVEVVLMETTTGGPCPQSYTITRTWTATDNCGNIDVGTQVITVEDTTPPMLDNVPDNVAVECDMIPLPPDVTAIDNCDVSVPVIFDEVNTPGNCPNQFTLTRSWTATDDCGNSVVASQTINVDDTQAPVLVGVPSDITVECDMVPAPANVMATDNCDPNVPVNFNESNDFTCPNSYIITRTWTAEDDCGNTTAATQIITVEDTTPPQINCPVFPPDTSFRFLNNPFVCELLHFISVSASDNCTDFSDLTIDWTVDFEGDGSIDTMGTLANFTPLVLIYPIGTNVATFTTVDECGNESSCEYVVVVIDNVAPSFFCTPVTDTLSFVTGLAYTSATEYVASPFFECCLDTILFELDDGTFTDELEWDCDATDFLPLGVDTKIRVFDCYGNSAACETKTIILPPVEVPDFCDPAPPLTSVITGSLYTEDFSFIENADVQLTGGMDMEDQTGEWGYYEFFGVPVNYNYQVQPELDVNPLNGVSTYDLVLILKHILEIQTLDSPYKMIAADIDDNGTISTFDVVALKKLILGIDSNFSNNTSWRFVDANFVFADPQNPFAVSFPEFCSINDLYLGVNDVNFIGIKIGDVNQTASTNLQEEVVDTRSGVLNLVAKDRIVRAGELVEIEFKASDFKNILGYQFTVDFNTDALNFNNLKTGALPGLSDNNFGLALLEKGWLTTSWHDIKGQSLDDDAVLFTLAFEAKTKSMLSKVLNITSGFTRSEAYSAGTEQVVQLRYEEPEPGSELNNAITLYQNRPNPFKDQTTISFNTLLDEKITLEIFDASGRSCFIQSQFLEAGYQEMVIQASDLPAAGIYYYELRNATQTVRSKMVAIW